MNSGSKFRLFAVTSVVFASCVVNAGSLYQEFVNPPKGYGEVPFWWWSGEKLDKERIAWQLEELAKKGVSGTQVNYSHLRSGGWKTAPVEPEIFSDEWWDVFIFAAKKSRELGMGIGLSGYTLDWPGRDNLYRKLGISTPETRAWVIEEDHQNGGVHFLQKDGTYDPIRKGSGQLVIDRFFKPFWDKVPADCHDALDYFFQDELRLADGYFPWCEDFPEEFRKRKGYDVVPKLPLLFGELREDAEKVRIDYNDVVVALTEERYFRPIYDWHASRGKIYACDPATRGKNPCEFGDYMRCMRWYTAPGFDTPGKDADHVKCKMGSSIAHLYNRPRVWLEGYHSQGWQASPSTIFDSTVHNYAYGANLFNLHGLYYSTYGGWWEWAPPCYHFHQPYWAYMDHTFKYFERLSYMLTRGRHVCDVAIVTPQEPYVVDKKRAANSVKLAHSLVWKLAVDGTTDCDFIDSDSIAAAEVTRNEFGVALSVAGENYHVIILPDMFAMRETMKAKLAEFKSEGGKVIDAKNYDDVVLPLMKRPDVVGKGVKYNHRRTDEYDIYYVVDVEPHSSVEFRTDGVPEEWDLWTGEKESVRYSTFNGVTTVAFDDDHKGPHLIVFDRRKKSEACHLVADHSQPKEIDIPDDWTVEFIPTLDNRWGDYRFPKSGMIGPEVRRMHWVELDRDEDLGYGPQFYVSSSTSTSSLHLLEFSWRYGVFGKPGNQDCHHGLNRKVTDCNFIMGPYSPAAFYDMNPKRGDKPPRTKYETYVYSAEDLWNVHILSDGIAPSEGDWPAPKPLYVKVNGAECPIDKVVELKKGYNKVEVEYEAFGRAGIAFYRPSSMACPELPLSSSWWMLPARHCFDPFGGKYTRGTFTASVPPGTVDADVEVYGKLLRKEIKDGVLTVEVEFEPGYVGGNAFKREVALKTVTAKIPLGDWARYEGLRCYSGGARYRTKVYIDSSTSTRNFNLSLGQVGCCAGVRVNGGPEHVIMCPPWEVDVTKDLRSGETNEISVTVYNTLNNHYQTIPTRYKVPTDQEPSGLIGPVKMLLK